MSVTLSVSLILSDVLPARLDAERFPRPPPATSCASPMTTVNTQIRALLRKEHTILARRRASTAFELGAAPLLLILLGIINAIQKLPLPDSKATSIVTFGGTTTTTPISCAVFDGVDGQYGYGVRMPNEWCVPIVFAPWTTETALLISILADRNGYRAPLRYIGDYERLPAPYYRLESLNGTALEPGDGMHPCNSYPWGPTSVQRRQCTAEMATVVLGFEDVPSLKSWLQTTTGRATIAIIFGDTTDTTSSFNGAAGGGLGGGSQGGLITSVDSAEARSALLYEVWYNRSVLANGWAASAGLDALGLTSRLDPRRRDSTRLRDSDMLIGSIQMVCTVPDPAPTPLPCHVSRPRSLADRRAHHATLQPTVRPYPTPLPASG